MRTSKKIGLFLLAFFAVLAALGLSSHLYISFQKADAARQLQTSFERESFVPEEIREDIAYLEYLLEKVHPREISSFPLGDARPALQRLAGAIEQTLTYSEFYRMIAPLGNLLNDEHTMVFPRETDLEGLYEAGTSLFPIDVRFIDNKLYVTRDLANDSAIQAGAEIISINNVPAEVLRETLSTYYSGTGNEQKNFYLQEKFAEALRLVYGFGDSFEVLIGDSKSGESEKVLVFGEEFSRPLFEAYRFDIVDPDTILLTYNAFEDENGTFANFLQEIFSTARQQNIQTLIIDIRSNQGGVTAYGDDILAYFVTRPFSQISRIEVTVSEEIRDDFLNQAPSWIRWFPVQYFHPMLRPLWSSEVGETVTITVDPVVPGNNPLRFTGEVYLLIGPGTMSSASLFAAAMKKYGVATLIGEPTGGYATLYGNMIYAHLPNTGLRVSMPTSVVYGNGTSPVMPDYPITQVVSDLSGGRDTALELARCLARSALTVCSDLVE